MAIYEVVKKIPRGRVMTYGDVAMQSLTHPRAVGRVLHNNPDPKTIPCHRVVFADGSLSPAYAFGGEGKQRALLEAEGVIFQNDKVCLSRSRM